MPMFDNFFGSGDSDKKRELEENIEKIRQKVQQEGIDAEPGQSPRRQPQRDEGAPAQSRDASPGSGDAAPVPTQAEQMDDEPAQRPPQQREERSPAGSDTVEQRQDEGGSRDRPQEAEQRAGPADTDGGPEPPQPLPPQEGSQDTAAAQQQVQQPESSDQSSSGLRNESVEQARNTSEQSRESRLSRDEVPEPPEVKDLDIPDIDKGPLFITVNKFKDALTTLSEMEQLVQDIEAQVGSLENTLNEDRETEDRMRRLLDETIEDTEVIQSIVSPESSE